MNALHVPLHWWRNQRTDEGGAAMSHYRIDSDAQREKSA